VHYTFGHDEIQVTKGKRNPLERLPHALIWIVRFVGTCPTMVLASLTRAVVGIKLPRAGLRHWSEFVRGILMMGTACRSRQRRPNCVHSLSPWGANCNTTLTTRRGWNRIVSSLVISSTNLSRQCGLEQLTPIQLGTSAWSATGITICGGKFLLLIKGGV
jgi:hypothetical protein